MKKNLIIGAAVAVIVISVLSFYGGMMYEKSANSSKRFEQMGSLQNGNQNLKAGLQNGGGLTTGEIISKDDQSITIKTKDNSSKIIFYSNTTEINKFTSGSISDIEIGKTVMVTGTTNQDGSLTAKSIQIGQINPSPQQGNQTPPQ